MFLEVFNWNSENPGIFNINFFTILINFQGAATDPKEWKVRFGSSRASRGGKLYDIIKIVVHPQFDEDTVNMDFALFRTKSSVTRNDNTAVIALAPADFLPPAGTEVLTSGLGATENVNQSTEFLRGAVVKISDMQACNASYSHKLTEFMICAGSQHGQDSCQVFLIFNFMRGESLRIFFNCYFTEFFFKFKKKNILSEPPLKISLFIIFLFLQGDSGLELFNFTLNF